MPFHTVGGEFDCLHITISSRFREQSADEGPDLLIKVANMQYPIMGSRSLPDRNQHRGPMLSCRWTECSVSRTPHE
jgi:hypothetical protein